MKKIVSVLLHITIISIFAACTFDYGESGSEERENPDLVMENVEYVRIRSSDPIARFKAERAERYEKQGVMKLHNFSFEQYGDKGTEVNALGEAGYASVIIESGDIFMDNGVRIVVDSEDIILETKQLDWKDEARTLASGDQNEVNIYQKSGTHFIGIGLFVNARNRTLDFSGNIHGTFVSEEEEEEKPPRPKAPPKRPQTPVDSDEKRSESDEPDEEDEWERQAK